MSLTQLKCLISAKADKDRKKTIKHEYRVPQLQVRIDKQTDSIANEADQEIGRYPILIWGRPVPSRSASRIGKACSSIGNTWMELPDQTEKTDAKAISRQVFSCWLIVAVPGSSLLCDHSD